jgi:hypothetical protein
VNIGSVDHSFQQFHTQGPQSEELRRSLDDLRSAIEQLTIPSAEKADARVDTEQIGLELQRSKPEKASIWKRLERLDTLVGLTEKVAKVYDALDKSGLFQ